MPKYRAYAIIDASKYIGEIDAESAEDAEEKAWEHENADAPCLCHHCVGEVDIGDVIRLLVEEVKGE